MKSMKTLTQRQIDMLRAAKRAKDIAEHNSSIPLTFCTKVSKTVIEHTPHGIVKRVVQEDIE